MAGAREEIEGLGARVVAVGRHTRDQARALEERWVPYPCLVDPEGGVYRALGIRRFRSEDLKDPAKLLTMAKAYIVGFATGTMQGKPSGTRQLPGVAIVDADRRLRYLYRGGIIGDYPPFDDVMSALREVVDGS